MRILRALLEEEALSMGGTYAISLRGVMSQAKGHRVTLESSVIVLTLWSQRLPAPKLKRPSQVVPCCPDTGPASQKSDPR